MDQFFWCPFSRQRSPRRSVHFDVWDLRPATLETWFPPFKFLLPPVPSYPGHFLRCLLMSRVLMCAEVGLSSPLSLIFFFFLVFFFFFLRFCFAFNEFSAPSLLYFPFIPVGTRFFFLPGRESHLNLLSDSFPAARHFMVVRAVCDLVCDYCLLL